MTYLYLNLFKNNKFYYLYKVITNNKLFILINTLHSAWHMANIE